MSGHTTFAWCLGLVCVPLVTAAQPLGDDALDASVDAATIIERALEQAARQRAAAFELDFEYITDGSVASLDGDGRVTRIETTRNRHFPLEGHFYSELIARDGRPLDEDAARDEWEKKDDFAREARQHTARGERYAPDEMRVDFDHDLMDRYVTTLVGTDIVAGRVCWVIRFEPREGRLPDSRHLDKAMNRSTGRLWIAQHDYGVRRAVFEMQRPFRWLWGIRRHPPARDGPARFPKGRTEPLDSRPDSGRDRAGRVLRLEDDTAPHQERVGRTPTAGVRGGDHAALTVPDGRLRAPDPSLRVTGSTATRPGRIPCGEHREARRRRRARSPVGPTGERSAPMR